MLNFFFTYSGISLMLLFSSVAVAAQTSTWTLESTAQQLLHAAPEKAAAEAELRRQQGRLHQASIWPNPSIELSATNALGKDDGQGGVDMNEFTFRQALPINGRLNLQNKQANAQVQQAEAEITQQNLLLERQAARIFHTLQFSQSQLKLAERRLESANEFQHIGRRREQAGDLSRIERLRLDLVRESSKQSLIAATAALQKAQTDFQTLLNIDDANPLTEPLQQAPELPILEKLNTLQINHPSLVAARQAVEAANHNLALVRVNRFSDPEIWVSRERDILADRRQNAMSIGVSVTLPLWDRSKGAIESARANKQKQQRNVEALQRQLTSRLQLNHLQLSHLIKQSEKYRMHVLEPAEEIFQLSRKGFAAGQVEILNLVDAVDTYFEARKHYLELLQEAWLEMADLRHAAGLSVLSK